MLILLGYQEFSFGTIIRDKHNIYSVNGSNSLAYRLGWSNAPYEQYRYGYLYAYISHMKSIFLGKRVLLFHENIALIFI